METRDSTSEDHRIVMQLTDDEAYYLVSSLRDWIYLKRIEQDWPVHAIKMIESIADKLSDVEG